MTELSLPLNIPDLEIISQAINKKGEIIVSVKSSKQSVISAENPRQLGMVQHGN